jgi:hypothetical protein
MTNEKIYNALERLSYLSNEEKLLLVSEILKKSSPWDLKRVLCTVLDVDYMDDAALMEKMKGIIYTR